MILHGHHRSLHTDIPSSIPLRCASAVQTHCVERVASVRCPVTWMRGQPGRCEWANDYEDAAVGLCTYLLSVPFIHNRCYGSAAAGPLLAADAEKCTTWGGGGSMLALGIKGVDGIISQHPWKKPAEFLVQNARMMKRVVKLLDPHPPSL